MTPHALPAKLMTAAQREDVPFRNFFEADGACRPCPAKVTAHRIIKKHSRILATSGFEELGELVALVLRCDIDLLVTSSSEQQPHQGLQRGASDLRLLGDC